MRTPKSKENKSDLADLSWLHFKEAPKLVTEIPGPKSKEILRKQHLFRIFIGGEENWQKMKL